MKKYLPLLAFAPFGSALAQSLNQYPGLTPEESFVAASIVTFVSAFISSKLTTLLKLWWNTTGVATGTVSAVLNALIAGVGGWYAHIYPHDGHGFFMVLASVILAYATATGIHVSQQVSSAKGVALALGTGTAQRAETGGPQ